MFNLDFLGVSSPFNEERLLHRELIIRLREKTPRLPTQLVGNAGFLVIWELQARLSAIVIVGLIALASIWIAFLVALLWAILAAHLYDVGMRKGYPDVFETEVKTNEMSKLRLRLVGTLITWAKVIFLAGVDFVILAKGSDWFQRHCGSQNLAKLTHRLTIAASLVIFGVTANHHLLRKAGYSPQKVYWGNMAARFANVPFTIFVGTVRVASYGMLIGLVGSWSI